MQLKIAYLEPGKVLTQSVIGKQEQARQQKVHDILLQAGKDAEARYAEMTPEQKQKARWQIKRYLITSGRQNSVMPGKSA